MKADFALGMMLIKRGLAEKENEAASGGKALPPEALSRAPGQAHRAGERMRRWTFCPFFGQDLNYLGGNYHEPQVCVPVLGREQGHA